MGSTLIEDGWLILTDGSDTMEVYFKECIARLVRAPKMKRYEGGFNLRYDLKKKYLTLKIKFIYLPTYAKFATFIDTMNSWQDSGDITVSVERNSDGDLIEFKGDGNGTTFDMMMPEGIGDFMKVSLGNQQVYLIKLQRLEE